MKEKAKSISSGILRALAVIAGILILLWFVFQIQALLLYIGIAAVIALISRPVLIFFRDYLKMGNILASMLTLILILSIVAGMLRIFVPIIVEQSKNISNIDFELVKSDLNELSIQASDYLGVKQIDIIEGIKRTDYVQNFDIEIIPSFIDIFFGNIGNFMVGLFAILFISFFFLRDENLIPNMITAFAKKGREKRILLVLNKTKSLLSRYFLGLLLQIMILNIVPYLGPIIAGALMMLVVLSNNLGADFSSELLPLLLYTLGGYSLAQIFDNLITQPVIFGKSVRSHPLEIFIIILIGGYLFGIPGMILAVPTYTALKVISKEFLSEYKIVKRLTKNL